MIIGLMCYVNMCLFLLRNFVLLSVFNEILMLLLYLFHNYSAST